MASEPRRDPIADELLTPENAAFLLIDYQPVQVNSISSMERQRLVSNITRATRAAVAYRLPIVHSTVNVQSGRNKPTIAVLRRMLEKGGLPPALCRHDGQRRRRCCGGVSPALCGVSAPR